MRLSYRLAAVKDRIKKRKKKKVGGRGRSIVKNDSRSTAICREIPEEILIEILARLPGNSLIRFKCVSKLWFSLISSKYFTDFFFKFSSLMSQRRRVFLYTDQYTLFSSSPLTGSLLQLNRDLTLPGKEEDRLYFVNSLRGLMCFRVVGKEIPREVRIINFTTRQVLSLPLVKTNMLESDGSHMWMWNYLGYDHVNDEYKVLSTIIQRYNNETGVRSETQVLVLGAGASWRNTKSLTSPPPHHSPHEGISINGVLYYAAWSHDIRCVMMSFDWNSEEFNLIEFPTESWITLSGHLIMISLMNYRGQVALLDCSRLYYESTLYLWVAEDVGKSNWSRKGFELPYYQLRRSLDIYDFEIRGTGRSGEITLSGKYVDRDKKSIHAFYDLEKNCITSKVVFEPSYTTDYGVLYTTLWDDVESIMYLKA